MAAPKLFILDSNAYFRLAYSLHPLLGQQFGKSKSERYVMRVIAQLEEEYKRSARLQHKFYWVKDKQFSNNRQAERLHISVKQNREVQKARSFILSHEKDLGLNISLVDATALAIGFVKKQPVVTDDADMCAVATDLGIEVWSMLQLLKLMVDEEHIDLDKAKEVAQFLDHEDDLPSGRKAFVKQFTQFFGSSPFADA